MRYDLTQPISVLNGVGPQVSKKLQYLEIYTLLDLLLHLPFRYEDRSRIAGINHAQPGETLTIIGTLESIKNDYTRSGRVIQKGVLSDQEQTIDLMWFNQRFLPQTLKPGQTVAVYGKIETSGKKRIIIAPDYETVTSSKNLNHMGKIIGIYPETAGLTSKWLRSTIKRLLDNLEGSEGFPDHESITLQWYEAVQQIHFPTSQDQITSAKARLAIDELILMQLLSLNRKKQWMDTKKSVRLPSNQSDLNDLFAHIPFELTPSQKHAIEQISHDLSSTVPMNRLLEGDVGSGKTIVAAVAAYIVWKNDHKSLLLAPTQILATQHYQTFSSLLTPYGIKVGLVLGGTKKDTSSDYDIYIGTHALLSKHLTDTNIGLVIVDEQHRFGVEQRAQLTQKGQSPHVLTMTATPIPRTVALVRHGDLEISYLLKPPSGRLPVKTWLVPPVKRGAAYEWVKTEVQTHASQVFIVCPFVEPSETVATVKAATVEFEKLQHILHPLKLGLLHGRMSGKIKDQIIAEFRAKKFDVLVTTPVVEVGIDVPSATIMVIEDPERFGLAQLHQLRGRVGRGEKQSYCLLFANSDTQRLEALVKHSSGHELAEIDFRLRGPGHIYGLAQHGQQQFKIATFDDFAHLELATRLAQTYFHSLDSHPLLKKLVQTDKIELIQPN